jgi:ABC-type transport system involved in cytochrome bd biosynthesis fused ATPase/permease subunit
MRRKWLLLLVIALIIAAATAAIGLLDKSGTDFAWRLAAGTAIGTAVGWFIERGLTK